MRMGNLSLHISHHISTFYKVNLWDPPTGAKLLCLARAARPWLTTSNSHGGLRIRNANMTQSLHICRSGQVVIGHANQKSARIKHPPKIRDWASDQQRRRICAPRTPPTWSVGWPKCICNHKYIYNYITLTERTCGLSPCPKCPKKLKKSKDSQTRPKVGPWVRNTKAAKQLLSSWGLDLQQHTGSMASTARVAAFYCILFCQCIQETTPQDVKIQ